MFDSGGTGDVAVVYTVDCERQLTKSWCYLVAVLCIASQEKQSASEKLHIASDLVSMNKTSHRKDIFFRTVDVHTLHLSLLGLISHINRETCVGAAVEAEM